MRTTSTPTNLPTDTFSKNSRNDPWCTTIGRLLNLGETPIMSTEKALEGTRERPHIRNNTARLRRPWNAAVDVLDRLSPCRVLVAWRDATAGCYGSQIWQTATAKTRDVCVLSGREIESGALVYRPRMSSSMMPANADALILASVLEDALVAQEIDG